MKHAHQKRRKTPRRAVRRHGKRAAGALAAGAAIAGGTHAYADPIRFDNPGGASHFVWTASAGQDVLDVRLDALSQPGVLGSAGTFEREGPPSYYGERVRVGADSAIHKLNVNSFSRLAGVNAGELIPAPSLLFGTEAYIYVTYPGYTGSLLPEGQQTYLGVRFDLGAGNQYGWIGVVRTGLEVDAFAWGYETDAGVPIPAGIPEPGTLAMLAFGVAAAALSRRQRRGQQLD